MFWNNVNTKKVEQLEEDIKQLRKAFESLKLDVDIWYSKLKSVKNIRPVQQVSEQQNIKDSVLLGENGLPVSSLGSRSRS